MSSATAPDWLNNGDNAWQLTAATLVALQSIPGLVAIYAGIVKQKWAINSAFMAFYAFAAVLICWVVWAYKMAFGKQWGAAPFVGTPGPVVTMKGVIDYSGGYVIHLSSGTAGFVGAAVIGPRLKADREDTRPNNILLVLVGAGILWMGWNGFNGGDPYTASPDAGAAVLNTNIATAMSTLVWTILDLIFFRKPAVIGAVQGMITGLVAITPAAGVVAGWGAVIIGSLSGSVPWLSMNLMGKKVALFRWVDDTLGVFHTHAVAGVLGGFLVGLFATKEGCEAFALKTPGGAIEGHGRQVWLQIVGALFIIGLNLFMTPLILYFIKYVLRIPLRMPEEVLLIGDDAIHGEEAYGFSLGSGHRSMLYGDTTRGPISGDPEIGPFTGHSPPRSTPPQSTGGVSENKHEIPAARKSD
ncbi:hypothetical protein DTO169E5_5406 [Paecilomyces variotii]|nr:hypothetical protein DTO169E5_5406 [Paecilomyces variotii]